MGSLCRVRARCVSWYVAPVRGAGTYEMVRTRSGARGERQVNGGEILMAISSARVSSSPPASGSSSLIGVSWPRARSRAPGAAVRPPLGRSRSSTTRARRAGASSTRSRKKSSGSAPAARSTGEQGAVRGERLGQFGDDGRGAGQFGERGGEAAARRTGRGALGPDDRQGVGQLGSQGLGRVAVGHDGRPAAFGDAVEAVGDLLDGLGRRVEQGGAVEQREERGEQRPQDAGGGTGEGLVVVVGAVAIGMNKPWEAFTDSLSGERAGATATTVQPRR